MVFIRGVNDAFDTGLNDQFGAFVAGEKRHVKRRAF